MNALIVNVYKRTVGTTPSYSNNSEMRTHDTEIIPNTHIYTRTVHQIKQPCHGTNRACNGVVWIVLVTGTHILRKKNRACIKY